MTEEVSSSWSVSYKGDGGGGTKKVLIINFTKYNNNMNIYMILMILKAVLPKCMVKQLHVLLC